MTLEVCICLNLIKISSCLILMFLRVTTNWTTKVKKIWFDSFKLLKSWGYETNIFGINDIHYSPKVWMIGFSANSIAYKSGSIAQDLGINSFDASKPSYLFAWLITIDPADPDIDLWKVFLGMTSAPLARFRWTIWSVSYTHLTLPTKRIV